MKTIKKKDEQIVWYGIMKEFEYQTFLRYLFTTVYSVACLFTKSKAKFLNFKIIKLKPFNYIFNHTE